mgnify:CR=1 FL=1
MCLLFCNNALSFTFSNLECPKLIYIASVVKKNLYKSLESKELSICKYYIYNSNQLYKYILDLNIECPCIDLRESKIGFFLNKAEKSLKISNCHQIIKKSLSEVNIIVDDIISCKNNS